MDNLNWDDQGRSFFDEQFFSWKPHPPEQHGPYVHISTKNGPWILPSPLIFSSSHLQDYANLLNCIQRHTKCYPSSCLHKKVLLLFPAMDFNRDFNPTSSLIIDYSGQKKYVPIRNDDRLNVHKSDMLYIWRVNINFQMILSQHVVLRYIIKYASKPETKSESY